MFFRYFFAIIFFPFTCQPGDDTSRMLGNPHLSLESCTTGSSKSLLFGRYLASNRKVSPVYREGFFQMVLKSCSSTQFIAFWWIANKVSLIKFAHFKVFNETSIFNFIYSGLPWP